MSKVIYRKKGRQAFYPLLALSALVLFGGALINILAPKRTQIELENRKAAQFPALSVDGLLDGSWQTSFANWMQDQFLLRDQWINRRNRIPESGRRWDSAG